MQPRTKRQKEVLDFIIYYIDKYGCEPSYQRIAKQLGVHSKGGIAKHVKALENQGLLIRKRVAGSFNIEISSKNSALDSISLIEWINTPSETSFREIWEENSLFVPKFLLGYLEPEKFCAFRVQDDSMLEKNIVEGDIVLIEKRSFVRDGECIAAIVEKKHTVLKTYFRAGANIELHSANKNFEIIKLPADKIQIQGVYRGLLRPLL